MLKYISSLICLLIVLLFDSGVAGFVGITVICLALFQHLYAPKKNPGMALDQAQRIADQRLNR